MRTQVKKVEREVPGEATGKGRRTCRMWWPYGYRQLDNDPFAEFDGRAPRRRAADAESEPPFAGARHVAPLWRPPSASSE